MADYLNGVTIKVNGVAVDISSAQRQTDHAVVRYTIPVLWHGSGDTVTWEYASASGNIVAESGGTALGDVTAQAVTNNCEYAALLDLQADTLALADNDPVTTWADQSGQGHDFTLIPGDFGATKQTDSDGKACIDTGGNAAFNGGQFCDNETSFSVFLVTNARGTDMLSKSEDSFHVGWTMAGNEAFYSSAIDHYIDSDYDPFPLPEGTKYIFAAQKRSASSLHVYINGSTAGESLLDTGLGNFSSPEQVRLFWGYSNFRMYCVLVFVAAPSDTNRAALEARLAARCGVTL